MRRFAALAIVLCALGVSGCSDDKSVATPSPPPVGEAASSKFGVPIPAGAIPEPDPARPDDERFRVADKSVPDMYAFFAKDVDNKPLQDFEWCGTDSTTTRVWIKPGAEPETSELLTVGIAQESSDTVVTISRVTATSPVTCPPQGPEGP